MKNPIKINSCHAIIYARDGEEIVVDRDMAYTLASKYKWHINPKDGEPMTNTKINKKAYRIKLKLIVKNEFQSGKQVYYKSDNRLDNRRTNLTFCDNEIILYENYAVILPTKNSKQQYRVKIDLEDVNKVRQYSWTIKKFGYMFRRENRKNIYLHDYIMSIDPSENLGSVIDHIDRDPSNNQKANLRLATLSENHANKAKVNKDQTSRYKGVGWLERDGLWRSRIVVNDQEINLGRYSCENVAAFVYNVAAKKYFNDFAWLNDIPHMSNEEVLQHTYQSKRQSHTNYTGITYRPNTKKWTACYVIEDKYYHIGTFDSEIKAAEAYNKEIITKNIDKDINIFK